MILIYQLIKLELIINSSKRLFITDEDIPKVRMISTVLIWNEEFLLGNGT